VREAAAHTLHAVLGADYLEHADLRKAATAALAGALAKPDGEVALRVAALDALGDAGAAALKDEAAVGQLKLDHLPDTFSERSALLRALGRLEVAAQRDGVRTFFEQLPLDAPGEARQAAGLALIRLDPDQAPKALAQRLQRGYAAGLGVEENITLLGELPAAAAVPALLDAAKLALRPSEKIALARACEKVADARLVPPLAGLLDPRQPGVRWQAVQALLKINTLEAAKALLPHLREEADLFRKLQIAEVLGRHGLRDGYPYAMEHLSEPGLLEQAVAALAAIREPKAAGVLRDILKTSNDTAWNGVAIRALGALGEKDVAGQCLEIVQDLKHPLAPAALVALGDLGEARALPRVKEGLASRNERVALASARAAGKLLALPGVKGDELRDQLAALVADADAEQELRVAALEALVALQDARLDKALAAAARDAGLEGGPLLERTERLLRERKVKLL
jgi:HEAT repeat protein